MLIILAILFIYFYHQNFTLLPSIFSYYGYDDFFPFTQGYYYPYYDPQFYPFQKNTYPIGYNGISGYVGPQ